MSVHTPDETYNPDDDWFVANAPPPGTTPPPVAPPAAAAPPPPAPTPTATAGPAAPASFGFDAALAKVQAAAGRTLSGAEIDALFARFGGNRNSQFTDASLAPVIAAVGSAGGANPGAGFGDVPPPYASNPTAPTAPVAPAPLAPYVAPTYSGDTPLPTRPAYLDTPYVAPVWAEQFVAPDKPTSLQTEFRAPTQAELEASPGYLARLKAEQQVRERSAAARGSILSGGTQVALGRAAQDYASNEYGNLYGQGLTTRQQTVGEFNTDFTHAFDQYLQKYREFGDAANLGLSARQQNVGEFQTTLGNAQTANTNRYSQFLTGANLALGARQQNVGEASTAANRAQTTYQNQYTAWLDENARTLSDYLTNTKAKRDAQTDYWNRLNDLANRGLTGAVNSRVA